MRMTSLIYFVIYIITCLERVHTGSDLNQTRIPGNDNYAETGKRDSRVNKCLNYQNSLKDGVRIPSQNENLKPDFTGFTTRDFNVLFFPNHTTGNKTKAHPSQARCSKIPNKSTENI